jgi:hypothetical protein
VQRQERADFGLQRNWVSASQFEAKIEQEVPARDRDFGADDVVELERDVVLDVDRARGELMELAGADEDYGSPESCDENEIAEAERTQLPELSWSM